MAHSWHQVDKLRPTWLFLLIQTERTAESAAEDSAESEDAAPRIQGWECGIGNRDQFIEGEAAHLTGEATASERELLDGLLAMIDRYRFRETTVITPDTGTLQHLRQRLVALDTDNRHSLRGLTHLAADAAIDQTFGQHPVDEQQLPTDWDGPRDTVAEGAAPSGAARRLWRQWRTLSILVPADRLDGEPL